MKIRKMKYSYLKVVGYFNEHNAIILPILFEICVVLLK